MKNYLISEAIGDIAGSVYEGRTKRIKDYDKVKLFGTGAHFTDDTVLPLPVLWLMLIISRYLTLSSIRLLRNCLNGWLT